MTFVTGYLLYFSSVIMKYSMGNRKRKASGQPQKTKQTEDGKSTVSLPATVQSDSMEPVSKKVSL